VGRLVGGDWDCRSALDAGPVAPLTANDLVAFFEGAFSFTVLALPFYLSGLLLHVGHSHDNARGCLPLAESRARRSVVQAKDSDGECTDCGSCGIVVGLCSAVLRG